MCVSWTLVYSGTYSFPLFLNEVRTILTGFKHLVTLPHPTIPTFHTNYYKQGQTIFINVLKYFIFNLSSVLFKNLFSVILDSQEVARIVQRELPLFFHLGRSSGYKFIWECLDFLNIPKNYFRCIQIDSSLLFSTWKMSYYLLCLPSFLVRNPLSFTLISPVGKVLFLPLCYQNFFVSF